MSSPDAPAIRLVIQFIDEGKSPAYRVVAYPVRKPLRLQPAEFTSRPELLNRLTLAMLSFDQTLLAIEDSASGYLLGLVGGDRRAVDRSGRSLPGLSAERPL